MTKENFTKKVFPEIVSLMEKGLGLLEVLSFLKLDEYTYYRKSNPEQKRKIEEIKLLQQNPYYGKTRY